CFGGRIVKGNWIAATGGPLATNIALQRGHRGEHNSETNTAMHECSSPRRFGLLRQQHSAVASAGGRAGEVLGHKAPVQREPGEERQHLWWPLQYGTGPAEGVECAQAVVHDSAVWIGGHERGHGIDVD